MCPSAVQTVTAANFLLLPSVAELTAKRCHTQDCHWDLAYARKCSALISAMIPKHGHLEQNAFCVAGQAALAIYTRISSWAVMLHMQATIALLSSSIGSLKSSSVDVPTASAAPCSTSQRTADSLSAPVSTCTCLQAASSCCCCSDRLCCTRDSSAALQLFWCV